MAEQFRKGGMIIIVEGECSGVRDSTNAKTGVVSKTFNLAFFGGEQYCTLADPAQAALLFKGAWVKVRCATRKFKDSMFPDHAYVIEIDGKSLPGR